MLQKLIAVCLLVIALCVAVRAQDTASAAALNKPKEPATGSIDGKVVNENGQPLAGAAVFVRAVNSNSTGRTATTDLDGSFRVSGLEPALYTITGSAPAYTTVPGDPSTPTYYRIGDTVRLEMIRGGVITGTVMNASGEPVITVRVRATMVRDARGETPKAIGFGGGEQSTDDRGVYRIYGLRPGTYIVSAGGAGFSSSFNPYDTDLPTFAPSSTRDNAGEVVVRGGEDSTVDIRYRGEPGHSISGTARLTGANGASITLVQGGSPLAATFQPPGARGFAFDGIGDGDYDLIAQEFTSDMGSPASTIANSEPRRVTVKGADVTGIELTTRALGSINGKILLESSKVPECQGKRPPLFAETMVRLQRPEKDKDSEKNDWMFARLFSSSASPDANGAFVLRNLMPGKYRFEPLFYARYWYLQSITLTTGAPRPQKIDAAANWTTVKSGEQLSNLTITLAQGAASIRGRIAVSEGAAIRAGTSVFLLPGEPDKADDVLRYFVSDIASDSTFTFDKLPPGRYLALVDTQPPTQTILRQPEGAAARTKLRRAAEARKNEIELKPCQTLTDYQPRQ
jgi:carboxypeptidase family protein